MDSLNLTSGGRVFDEQPIYENPTELGELAEMAEYVKMRAQSSNASSQCTVAAASATASVQHYYVPLLAPSQMLTPSLAPPTLAPPPSPLMMWLHDLECIRHLPEPIKRCLRNPDQDVKLDASLLCHLPQLAAHERNLCKTIRKLCAELRIPVYEYRELGSSSLARGRRGTLSMKARDFFLVTLMLESHQNPTILQTAMRALHGALMYAEEGGSIPGGAGAGASTGTGTHAYPPH